MSISTQRLGLLASCLAQLVVVLDVSVVNIALPSIRADLGLDADTAPWVAMAYGLGFAGTLLAGARLADVVGVARILVWSVAAFTFASVVGGLALDGRILIGARAAQGVAAAAMSPATLALLTVTHSEGRARTRAIAVWTAVSLAGGGFGNIVSGLLTETVSWRLTLLINLPIGLAVAVAAFILHRRLGDERGSGRVDVLGAVLATAAFSCATIALSTAGRSTDTLPALGAGGASVVLFIVLVARERRTPHGLVPAALLRNPGVVAGNLATALSGACFQVALWYFLTTRLQSDLGLSPIMTGLSFLPLTLGMLAVSLWLTPRLMERHEARSLVSTGVVFAVPGLVLLATIGEAPFAISVLAPIALVAIGGGLMNVPLATLVTSGVRREHAGAASGLMNTAKQFGGATGLAAGTAVATAAGTDRAAFVLMAVTLLAVLVVSIVIPVGGGDPGKQRP